MGKEAKKVPIDLDKPRTLLLDLNAMADYENATNSSFMDLGENMNAKSIRALLWACLRHEDTELGIHQVGAFIHTGNMQELTESLSKLYSDAMPKAKASKKKQDPLAPKSTD